MKENIEILHHKCLVHVFTNVLTKKEIKVLEMRFGLGQYKQRQIPGSGERIRQIQCKALRKINSHLEVMADDTRL